MGLDGHRDDWELCYAVLAGLCSHSVMPAMILSCSICYQLQTSDAYVSKGRRVGGGEKDSVPIHMGSMSFTKRDHFVVLRSS